MKKVLYLTHDGLTDSLGESQVLSYILELEKRSINYYIISFEKRKNKGKIKRINKLLENKNIRWHPITYYNKPFILGTLFNIVQLYFLLLYILIFNRPNLIHARSYLMTFVAISFKKIININVIFDMRGFWIDEKIESNSWSELQKSIVIDRLRFLESYSFKKADFIIALTNASKQELIAKFSIDSKNIEVIPTCVNNKYFYYDENIRQSFRSKLGIDQDTSIFLYSGSIGGYYNFDEMINIFIELKKIKQNSLFFILSVVDRNFILNKLRSRNINESDFIIDSCNLEDVHKYLCMADIGLILYDNSYSSLARCPTKMGEYIKCNLKVLAPLNVGDLNNVFNLNKNIGVQFDDYSKGSYKKALNKIIKFSRDEKVENFSFFDLEDGVNKYHNVYERF